MQDLNDKKDIIKSLNISTLFYILLLAAVLMNFLVLASTHNVRPRLLFGSYLSSSLTVFACIVAMLFAFIGLCSLLKKHPANAVAPACLSLFPVVLLLHANTQNGFLFPLGVTAATAVIFFKILSQPLNRSINGRSRDKMIIIVLTSAYFAVFTFIIVLKHANDAMFNPQDYFIYNEAFSNTLQGKFFQSTAYGSLFACHNTWFYVLLLPFYFIMPHPLTLMIGKTLLLALSVIPFCLIARLYIKNISLVPLVLAYLFYPYLVSQNFAPPHEIGYLPLFLLSAVYFFKTDKFVPFVVFLGLCLSIKEHVALIAVLFGAYAFFLKKPLRWSLTPVVCGIVWGVFSMLVLSHFKQLYPSHPAGAWLIEDLAHRFLSSENNLMDSLRHGLLTSNMAVSPDMALLLLLPVGIIPPLLSPISFLGTPELLINFLSDRPALLWPTRHYNVIVSCFLWAGVLAGLPRISKFKFVKKLKINPDIMILLCSTFIFSSTLLYAYLWLVFI